PAESMYDFVLFSDRIIDFARLFADSAQRSARAIFVVERAAVIVAELHDHKIARFELIENRLPAAFRKKSAAAASAQCAVGDLDFFEIEIRSQHVTPSPLAVGAVAAAVSDRGVADQIESRLGGLRDGS